MSSLQIGITLGWGVCAALAAAYALSVASEITYVTLADGRRTERRLPLTVRMLLPLVPNLARFAASPRFARTRETARWMIVAAGLEGLMSPVEFVAVKFLMPVVFGGLWCAFVFSVGALTPGSFLAQNASFLALAGTLWCYIWPVMWLRRTLAKRHQEIFRALPFVLDLLTLSVEAGMDFMSALQRNCERRKLDALNEELIRTTREIQVGTPRRTALRNLAERTRQPDVKGFSSALVQADELGVPIGAILRIQSDQLRARRFERAQKAASEAPVKMMLPLLLFIFPSVFIVLLGPILMQASKNLF